MGNRVEAAGLSVVIPAADRAHVLPRALRSVAAQRLAPAEVIVVDDGSSDDTAQVAAGFGAIVVRLAENQGPGAARNAGIARAANDWVALLDSDDEWLPQHLERLWPLRGDHVFVGGRALVVRGDGRRSLVGHPAPGTLVLERPADVLAPANPVPTSSVLLRRSALADAGGFRDFRYAEDLDAWIRMLAFGPALLTAEVHVIKHEPGPPEAAAMQRANRAQLDALLDRWAAEQRAPARAIEAARVMVAWDAFQDRRAAPGGHGSPGAGWLLARPGRVLALGALLARRARLRACLRRDPGFSEAARPR